jgi:membrane protease YdiL (CAAX protease family)
VIVNAVNLIPKRDNSQKTPQWLLNPFVRFFGYLLIFAIGVRLSGFLYYTILSTLFRNLPLLGEFIESLIMIVIMISIYFLLIRKIERRSVHEFSTNSCLTEMMAGTLIGGTLIGAVILILSVFGFYTIQSFNPAKNLLDGLIIFGAGAIFEEIIFRLVIFKLLEEYFGSWISMLISALLFGVAHMFNENATLWSAITIAIEAGILLSMAFIFTRRIWMIFGIHFTWNFMQATVFGLPASGLEFPGIINAAITGPVWLSGGDFGVEASLITVILGLVLSYFLFKKAYLDDQFILPAWRLKKKTEIRY